MRLGLCPGAPGAEPDEVTCGLRAPTKAGDGAPQAKRLGDAGRKICIAQTHHPADQPRLAEPPDEFRLIEGRHAIGESLVASVLDLRLRDGKALNRDHRVVLEVEATSDPDSSGIFVLL